MLSPSRFLVQVWREQGEGHFCISTKSRSGKWRDVFFKSPLKQSEIDQFLEDHSDRNLYFCITPFSEPHRQKKYVLGSKFLWADLDESDPRSLKLKPQIAWASSPGRYAALWRLNRFHKSGPIEESNKALTYSNGGDRAGWDLTQVLRIPGTHNYKYPSAPRGKLLWVNDNSMGLDGVPTSADSAEDAVELLNQYRKRIKTTTYALLTSRRATVGKRSEVIWKLENELHEQGIPKDHILALVKHSVWNKFAGRHDEDLQLRRELDKLPDHEKPRKTLAEVNNHHHVNGESSPIKRMSEVEPEEVFWLWYPYIPRGKVTLIEGDPGIGKSWITMALASHVSNRTKFPGATKFVGGRVLIMSAEDGLGDTIRPRLDTMGADTRKIFAYAQPVIFDEEGYEEVDKQVAELKPAIVLIDPLVAYMGGGVDMHKANETREIMYRLALIAEKHKTAVVAIRHLTKGTRDKSIYRGQGSIDITAAARSVMLVGRDPNESHARAVVHIKSNLAPTGASIKYELRPGFRHPFRWSGFTDTKAEDILKADRDANDVSEFSIAKDFIKSSLADGPRNGEVLKREAEGRGISPKILMRMAREMGVKFGEKWSL